MQNNVVVTIFNVESEAYQAFSELSKANVGEGYVVPEAALIKNVANTIELIDAFSVEGTSDGLARGVVIGSLVGVLGGPIGVILGASMGAQIGTVSDAGRAMDNYSVVAVVANKLFEGEIAIAALVSEDEPAFDAVFAKYETTVLRFDAADIADDVDRFYELEAAISEQVIQEAKADRKAARQERRAERRARIKDQLEEYAAATNRAMGEVTPM